MVILTGDMNTYENSPAYNFLVGEENHVVDGIPSHLKDSKYLSSTTYVGMPETANNWFDPLSGPIDYILTYGMIVNNYNVVNTKRTKKHPFDHNFRYPSDHMPVVVNTRLNN